MCTVNLVKTNPPTSGIGYKIVKKMPRGGYARVFSDGMDPESNYLTFRYSKRHHAAAPVSLDPDITGPDINHWHIYKNFETAREAADYSYRIGETIIVVEVSYKECHFSGDEQSDFSDSVSNHPEVLLARRMKILREIS